MVPKHLVEGKPPPPPPPRFRVEETFRLSKRDRVPKAGKRSPTSKTCDMTVPLPSFRSTLESRDDRGRPVTLTVVSHPILGVKLPKRNPAMSARGIARNGIGGYYTS